MLDKFIVEINTLYIDKDAVEFEIFKRVFYPRGVVRIIKLKIIYRSTPNRDRRIRRTILPIRVLDRVFDS